MRIRIYIAGPYTLPNPQQCTETAMTVWNELWEKGYAPYCPHWSHFQDQFIHRPYGEWLDYDLQFLRVCDAVLRLPGESQGAELEVQWAKRHALPIFYSIEELLQHFPPNLKIGDVI